jgi:hypothetical protein
MRHFLLFLSMLAAFAQTRPFLLNGGRGERGKSMRSYASSARIRLPTKLASDSENGTPPDGMSLVR